jgi:UDP-glucose 4-epimerase
MAQILVTGGAGFIGSHTVEHLLAAGNTITALDDLSSGHWTNIASGRGCVSLVVADVRDPVRLSAVVAGGGFDAIIHLAARASVIASVQRPVETHGVNVGGTLNVLEAARVAGVRRVVLASSASVYGATPPLPTAEDSPCRPVSPYAAQKAESELLCAAYRATYGLETVVLRYFNVYGRRQPADSPYSGVVAVLTDRLATARTVTIYGDGGQTRDFIHVSDVAAVNALAALGPDPGGEPINVASGERTSVLALLAQVRALLRTDAAVVFAPERPGDVRHSQADVARLRDRLGYTPRTPLRDGLRDLLGA